MQTTPLTDWHRQHHAKMMEFGGYLMPVEYPTGILAEHAAVRQRVGVFDVSHMGEFTVGGRRAGEFLDFVVTNRPSGLEIGQALYTPMCYPHGGTVDDLLVYRLDEQRFMMVVNAANIDKDWDWLNQVRQEWTDVELENQSQDVGLIALQGPQALALIEPLADQSVADIPYYHARRQQVAGVTALVSRTGYTGEDGFELYLPSAETLRVFDQLVQNGAVPAGLGARDTLRLEARLPLYGHELGEDITPLQAGLGVFVKWDKKSFIGQEALARQKAAGVNRRIVGLKVEDRIARQGYVLTDPASGSAVGEVTSGTLSPTLGYPIALALVDTTYAKLGTPLTVSVRGRLVPAVVVKTPFYRRSE